MLISTAETPCSSTQRAACCISGMRVPVELNRQRAILVAGLGQLESPPPSFDQRPGVDQVGRRQAESAAFAEPPAGTPGWCSRPSGPGRTARKAALGPSCNGSRTIGGTAGIERSRCSNARNSPRPESLAWNGDFILVSMRLGYETRRSARFEDVSISKTVDAESWVLTTEAGSSPARGGRGGPIDPSGGRRSVAETCRAGGCFRRDPAVRKAREKAAAEIRARTADVGRPDRGRASHVGNRSPRIKPHVSHVPSGRRSVCGDRRGCPGPGGCDPKSWPSTSIRACAVESSSMRRSTACPTSPAGAVAGRDLRRFPTGAWLHLDPDRRALRPSGARSLDDYAPGPAFWKALSGESPRGAIKLSPASDFASHFAGPEYEIELISLRGECKEATVWFGDSSLAAAGPPGSPKMSPGPIAMARHRDRAAVSPLST